MNATSAMYDSAVGDFARAEIDWERDTFKVMLVTGDYQPSQSQDATRRDLRGKEVDASGTYVRGGQTLPGRQVVRSELGGDHKLTAGTVAWENFTGAFRYAIVYQANGSPETDRLISYVDYGREQTVDNTNMSVTFADAAMEWISV